MSFKIVYRVAGLSAGRPLAGVRFHGERAGGDLSHVTPPEQYQQEGRTAPVAFQYDENGKRIPAAQAKSRDWVEAIRDEVKRAAQANTAAQVENLEARGKHKAARRRAREGDKDPFRSQKGGPLREFVISANAAWFQDDNREPGFWDAEKTGAFVKQAMAFAEKEWGSSLRYLRIDFDEGAPHIHGVAAPWAEVKTRTGAIQRMLAASKHTASAFEKAQDRAGKWFKGLGLVRGEKRAQARRTALDEGKAPPPKRRHVSPAQWRAQKAAELTIREKSVAEREQEADAVLALAGGVRAAAVEDKAARAAVEKAQAEASKREAAKAQAIAQAKALKSTRDAEARRRAAIAKAAKAAAAKKAGKAKARPPRQAAR
ncbi:plasmid recombination protein [Oceaniglobus indicus]|uniref:plasmid recombination protein n=1 Tax=Oceaniglobus indicus TaxID=2047749 RepID=UPI0011AB6AC5|nr:plasmid recombination protein [Oceaniglobus indicus]